MNFGKEFNVLWDIFFTEKNLSLHMYLISEPQLGEEDSSFTAASRASERLIHPGEDARQADVAGAHQ